MTKEELSCLANELWLGRLRIHKPKKNEKCGIPYKPWHHLAFIDKFVFTYVWDTREIIDVFMLSDVQPSFETVKLVDAGKALFVGKDTTSRAKAVVQQLLAKYKELPIVNGLARKTLVKVKEDTEAMLLDIDYDNFDVHDDAQTIFVDKTAPIPDNLYMYQEMFTVNPAKRKFADNTAYQGIAKQFAVQARCAILAEWSNLIKNDNGTEH